jgi:hypothetical protein
MDPAFESTTVDPEMGKQGAMGAAGSDLFEIHAPAGTPYVLGTFGERELILGRGLIYHVESAEEFDPKHGSMKYVVRVEVPDADR